MTDVKKVMVLSFPGKRSIGALNKVLGRGSFVWADLVAGGDVGFVFEAPVEVVCEQMCERELEVYPNDSVFAHPDLFEYGLVHRSSDLVGGVQVGSLTRRDDVEGGVKVLFDLFESVRAGVKDSLGSRFFRCDAGLFFSEEIYIDGVGVVGVEQLTSFAFKRAKALPLSVYFVLVELLGDFDVVGDVGSETVEFVCS